MNLNFAISFQDSIQDWPGVLKQPKHGHLPRLYPTELHRSRATRTPHGGLQLNRSRQRSQLHGARLWPLRPLVRHQSSSVRVHATHGSPCHGGARLPRRAEPELARNRAHQSAGKHGAREPEGECQEQLRRWEHVPALLVEQLVAEAGPLSCPVQQDAQPELCECWPLHGQCALGEGLLWQASIPVQEWTVF